MENPDREVEAPSPAAPGIALICPRCDQSVGRLPVTARFCPRCGGGLDAPPSDLAPVVGTTVEQDPVPFAVPWLPDAPGQTDPEKGGGIPDRSQIVIGYANAMYNLGWRYERGRGTHRNPDEAARCYHKSAKLGNEAAAERLGRTTDAVEPPPLPYADNDVA